MYILLINSDPLELFQTRQALMREGNCEDKINAVGCLAEAMASIQEDKPTEHLPQAIILDLDDCMPDGWAALLDKLHLLAPCFLKHCTTYLLTSSLLTAQNLCSEQYNVARLIHKPLDWFSVQLIRADMQKSLAVVV